MRRTSAEGSCLSGLHLVALTFKGFIRITRLMRFEPHSFESALVCIISNVFHLNGKTPAAAKVMQHLLFGAEHAAATALGAVSQFEPQRLEMDNVRA